ncbi:hypothetical protein [Pandoraea sp. NPDC087047]|uniref:hypothetical protein n=1 Tax=Pandoraea sp. NPDC087047 TaxID=3364390 RepID=UPI0037FC1AB3
MEAGSDASPAKRRTRRERRESDERDERDGEPNWLNSALVLGTAVFAAIALLGIWWNLRAPYVDPAPKVPGGLVVTPFNSGNEVPSVPSASSAMTPSGATSEASAALARAQALAAVDAAASGAAAEIAASSNTASSASLTASAATAALTAAATSLPRPPPANTAPAASPPATPPAPDDMMQLLSRRDTGTRSNAVRPGTNTDLPAHYDDNDIGPIAAAEAQRQVTPAPVASAPAAASTIAVALARCERYRWFEVIPKQRCIWAVCSGRWGRDGCPAGTNPGEQR